MKTNPIRVGLKLFTLAVPLGVVLWLGAGSSAQAQLPVTNGLVLRMDAAQITGTADLAQLNTWTDTSGLANNAVRQGASSAGYPQYVTNVVNGLPVVRFNSANNNKGDYFQFTRITTIRTVFWVVKATADGKFLLGDNSSYDFHRGYDGTYLNKIWDSRYAHANIQNGTTKLMGNAVDGTATVLPSGSFQLVSLVTTGNVNADQINQDRIYNGSWVGDIAEILIYNRALTVSEENQVGYYLANKYNLTTTYTAPQPPPSDALIHYDLEALNGTIVTNKGSLGSAANGVLQGGSVVAGQFGNALSFSGSGSGIITTNTVAISNAFTFACWVSTANGNANYRRIILNDYQQSGYLGTHDNGRYLTILKDNFVASTTFPDTSGAWHHLVMTWDGTTQKFYYDGVINTSAVPSPRDTTLTQKFGFGCNLGAGENWNGKMDDAYVFGRALSAAEVVNLYVNYVNTAPSTNKDILTFQSATISGTNITMSVAYGTPVTNLAPTYTVSPFASGSPASGTARDFTTPQTYTITAQDASTKEYRVTVNVRADSRPPVTSGLIVWLAADRVNLTDTNQVRVSGANTFIKQWNDGSGNARNATQSVAGDQPAYIDSALNGQPVLRFTQVNDDAGSQMELGDISASFSTAASMFSVATINGDGRYSLFDNRNNDSRWVANTWNESVPGVFRNDRQGMTYANWPQSGTRVFAMESGAGVYRFLTNNAVIGSNPGGSFHSGSGQNWIVGDGTGNGQQLNGDIPEMLLYNRILTTDEANAVGAYLAVKYSLATTYPALPAPTVPTGVTVSPVGSTSLSVSWTAGTNAQSYFVSVSNTVTTAVQVLAAGASPYTVTGLTPNTLYEFAVQSTNFTGASAYSATVSGTPSGSTAKNILTFLFPGQPDGIISGTNISVTMQVGTPVTALAPTYTISALATSSPASGTTRDFTSPQTYTVTAEDLSTQDYTVTVTLGAVPTNFTWTTGSSGNWSDSTKWVNDLANGIRPATFGFPYYTLNFNQAVTAANDLSTNYVLNQLNFGDTVTIPLGNSIRFTNNGAILPKLNQNSGNQVTIASPLSLTANTTLGGSGNGQVNISGVISGAGSLTKTNSGQLQLTGVNTFTGGTLISAGTVTLGSQSGFGTNSVTLAAGTTFQQANFEGNTAAGALSNAFVLSGTGNVIMNMPFGQKDVWLSQVVSGTGGFTVQGGSRQFNLTATNTFSGGIILKDFNNRIVIWNLSSLGTGTFRTERLTAGSGQLETAANLSAGAGVTNAVDIDSGAYLNVEANGNNHLLLSGPITSAVGNGNLYKYGTATLTLSGNNTYSGATTVSAGKLLVNGANSGAGAVSVASAAYLGGVGSIGGNVSYASGAFGLFTNGGTLAIAGTLTLNANVVRLNLPANLGTGNYTLATYNPAGSSGSFASTPVVDSGSILPGATATVTTSGGTVTLMVRTASVVTVTSSSQTNGYLDNVTFTATVSGAGTPTGTVLFKTNTVAFGGAVGLTAGAASTNLATLPRGTNVITAEYSGDVNYLASTGSLNQVVTNHPPVAKNLNAGVAQGGSVTLQIIGGKNSPADADSDSMTVTGVGIASSGTNSSTSTNVTYVASGTTGTNTFTYTVSDGFGGTDTKTVTVVVGAAQGFNLLSGPVNNGNGTFTFGYLGIPGQNYSLDESPDLVSPYTWFPVLTNAASGIGAISYTVPLSYTNGSFRTRHVP